LAIKTTMCKCLADLFACATCAIGDDGPLRAIVDDGMPIVRLTGRFTGRSGRPNVGLTMKTNDA
jgi:hypothetical protein